MLLVEQQARRALALADRWYLLSAGTVIDQGDRTSASDALEGGLPGQHDRTFETGRAEPQRMVNHVMGWL